VLDDVVEEVPGVQALALEPPLHVGEGEQHRVDYRVRFGDRDTVMRLCGKETDALGIDRDTEALATAQASALGIAPAVLARLDGVLVCEFLEGDVLDAAGVRARLDEAAAMLRAFHGSEALPTRFAVFELVSQQASLASVPDDFPELLATAERIRAALADQPLVPCHNDLLPANFVATPAALKLLDWEYAGMNVREFDLAVIIGGGVGGCSIAYHLAKLGWDDVVLVERAELTSGSTFHSAGLVGQLRGSVSLTKMMMYSVELYRTLEVGSTGWREVGRCGSRRRGADGGARAPGRLGEDVRAAARADLGRARRRRSSR
jgi:phytoene dehydrogenase-like protein